MEILGGVLAASLIVLLIVLALSTCMLMVWLVLDITNIDLGEIWRLLTRPFRKSEATTGIRIITDGDKYGDHDALSYIAEHGHDEAAAERRKDQVRWLIIEDARYIPAMVSVLNDEAELAMLRHSPTAGLSNDRTMRSYYIARSDWEEVAAKYEKLKGTEYEKEPEQN